MEATLLAWTGALGAAGPGGRELAKAIGAGSLAQMVLTCLVAWVMIKAGFIAFAVWFEANHPEATQEMVDLYRDKGGKCALVGVIDLVAGLILVLLLLATEVLGILGVLLFVALVALAAIGYAVAYLNFGQRLAANGAVDSQTRAMVRGGVAAETAFLVPILGQLLSLGMLLRGMGAAALVIIAHRRAHTPAPPPEEGPGQASKAKKPQR